MVNFGLRMLRRIALTTMPLAERPEAVRFDGECGLVPPRRVGEVEQVGHAGVLENLERDRARVHEGGQAKHGRERVRHDAGGATERREDAGLAPLQKPGGNGEDDARSRDEDDDQGGDQKFDGNHVGG